MSFDDNPNRLTCSLKHEIRDEDGTLLADISANYYRFNWQDVSQFQQRVLPPLVQDMLKMGAEFAGDPGAPLPPAPGV